jgi:hypothetical protein
MNMLALLAMTEAPTDEVAKNSSIPQSDRAA